MMRLVCGFLCVSVCLCANAGAARGPGPSIRDADTRAWWQITTDLSSDEMEGRDTGSPGHARAAAYVAARFAAAGLRPAGDAHRPASGQANGQAHSHANGRANGYTQALRLHEVRVESDGTDFAVVRDAGGESHLEFLHRISVRPSDSMPLTLNAPLTFRGYCSRADMDGGVSGRIAVCFGGRRRGVASATERLAAATAAGAVGLIAVDDPGFTLEPARWPEAYARTVTLADAPAAAAAVPVMRLSADAFADLIQGSGRAADELLALGAASKPLPSFDVPARLRAAFRVSRRDITSDNLLGLLPGTDPKVSREIVVVSAHLDGYGRGEPVAGDGLYNGTLDDAAYVATLIRLAESRHGRGFRRSVLFAAFTGEEKGLLGATAFTQHPTVPRDALVADINLDQLRPLFPLKILTMHAVDDSTLGATARAVAARLHIEIRPDREPERNLNQRADHWPFLQSGIPATGFVFGYDAGTESERRYREWYQVRYHRPQDDVSQPVDFVAARDFNRFFYEFTRAVGDASARPKMIPR